MLANMFRSQIPMEYLRSLKRSDSSPSFTSKKDESFSTAVNTPSSRDRKNLMFFDLFDWCLKSTSQITESPSLDQQQEKKAKTERNKRIEPQRETVVEFGRKATLTFLVPLDLVEALAKDGDGQHDDYHWKFCFESSSSPTIPNNHTQINHSRNKSIDENNSTNRGASNNRSSGSNHSRKCSVECSPLNPQLPPPAPPPPPPPPPAPPPPSSSSANSRSIVPHVNTRNGPPIPYTKRLLKHQSSLNDEDNNKNPLPLHHHHGMLSKSSSKASSTSSYQNQSSICSGENDGPLDESVANSNSSHNYNNNNNNSWEIGNENCSNFVINSNNSASIGSLYQKSNHNNNNNNNNNLSNTSSISNSRESNLNYGNSFQTQSIANNGHHSPQHHPTQQRPPAIRSLSSASSLSPTSSNNYNNNNTNNSNNNYNQSSTSPTKSIGGNPSFRQQRRGAMVSCENLLSENPELYGSSAESAFKNFKSRKIGSIFSNPFKSEPEKLEQLNELLQKYSEKGIPNPKHVISNIATSNSTNKLNHLRASSLSISGLLSGSGSGFGAGGGAANGIVPANNNASQLSTSLAAANNQGLLSTAKTSLSTTDLYRLNFSTNQNSNNSNGPLSTLSTPQHQQQQQYHHHAPSGQLLLSSASFDATVDSYYYLEPEWRSIVENSDKLPPKVQSRNEAIWELLQTEVSHIRRLKVINDVFIACLLNLQNECLLTEIDPKCVFSNITEVYEANHDFWIHYLLPMLIHSREKKCPLDPTMMKDGFLKFDQIFRPYRQYCFDLSKCTQYLKEKCKTNNLFKTYITWCESHKDCDRLGLSDFLAKPMQRLLKYDLLLQAILKKTDDEAQKESLVKMENCVKHFVEKLNISMTEHQRLSQVVSRIESYDAIDCSNDEAEKFLKDFLFLDLMQAMPDCSPDKIRRLYKEDTLKLKDSTNKQDVHCFLFTDVFLVCKPLNKKSNDGRMKVIRQPFITDRLIVRELKESLGFLLIYLNELKVASTYMLLFSADCRSWVEEIKRAQNDYRKAQNDYSNLKFVSINQQQQEFYANNAPMTTYHSYDDDYYGNTMDTHQLMFATSPRSSSRSSLVHSHSGSQDIGEQPHQSMLPSNNCNQLSIQQQSSRGISFELGDLRNPSLVVEDADALARSQSFDGRSPSVTITSPRHDRRAFLQRNQPQLQPQQSDAKTINYDDSGNSNHGIIGKTNVDFGGQNSLSLNVPYIQPVQNVPVQPRQSRRSVPNISNLGGSINNTITLNEPSNCLTNNTATIQVSVHPPPPSPSPPLPSPTSPAKRSPSRTTVISRPLPPLPTPPSPSVSAHLNAQQPTSPSTRSSPPTPPPAPPPPPPSLMSISSRSAPGPMTMTINKPPLVKTKNVSYGVASMSYAQEKPCGHTMAVFEPKDDVEAKEKNPINIQISDCLQNKRETSPSETDTRFCDRNAYDDVQQDFSEGDDSKNRCSMQQKRTCRPDRRYHTADSIEQLNKEKDNSIHKRLSWNYGQHQQQSLQQHHHPQANHHPGCIHYGHHHNNCSSINHHQSLLQPRSLASSSLSSSHHHQQNHLPNKCCSTESVCCSSGFSSTGSVPLSVGSLGDNPIMQPCDRPGCCTCCCCSDINQSRLQEEEEDIDEEDFKHNSCSATIRRNPSDSSDRDSALPVSPALNETGSMSPIGGYHHSHSNSQCSVDSCGGNIASISGCKTDNIQSTKTQKSNTPTVSNFNPDPDFRIDVHEMKDGISSVKITLANNSNPVSMPSKSNLKKIQELLLSDCNLESSEV